MHGDLNPTNILTKASAFDHEKVPELFIVDFGAAQPVPDLSGREPDLQPEPGAGGMSLFASHRADKLSQRDDLESAVYILVYLCRSTLPWMHHDFPEACTDKLELDIPAFCTGLPTAIQQTLEHCRALQFAEMPDYDRLEKAFDEDALRA